MSSIGNKEVFARNLEYYLFLTRKSRLDVCEALQIKYSTFNEWINAKKYPRIDKIEMLADYFGIQKSDLIEDKENLPKSERTYAAFEQAFKVLSESDREQVLDYMHFLATRVKQ